MIDMSQKPNDHRVHSVSDGKMEILAVNSSFHIAQLQVGLSKPIRLGQSNKIRIVLKRSFPAQADGEPWIQKPCEIIIEKIDQAAIKCIRSN